MPAASEDTKPAAGLGDAIAAIQAGKDSKVYSHDRRAARERTVHWACHPDRLKARAEDAPSALSLLMRWDSAHLADLAPPPFAYCLLPCVVNANVFGSPG